MVLIMLRLWNAQVTCHCIGKLHNDYNWSFHCVHGVV